VIIGKVSMLIKRYLLYIFIILISLNILGILIKILTGQWAVGEGALPAPSSRYAYVNCPAAAVSIILFSFFVLSYLAPMKKTNWRTVGIYEAFIIAIFAEMYGFPLTIYVLSSFWGIHLGFGHVEGHLLATALSKLGIIGLKEAWLGVMGASLVLILVGFVLISKGWNRVYSSRGELETSGVYTYMRHPQYLGIIIITAGLLVQWPTILTLTMWPILTVMYYRLAKGEEKEMEERFGEAYLKYKRHVPMFFPTHWSPLKEPG